MLKRKEEEEKKRLAKLERQKNERRCPGCDMKAFPEDSIKLGDLTYHKVCIVQVSLETESFSLSKYLQTTKIVCEKLKVDHILCVSVMFEMQ